MFSILYGQAVSLISEVATGITNTGTPFILTMVVLFMIALVSWISFEVLLMHSVVYGFFIVFQLLDCYFRVHFNTLEITATSLIDKLLLVALWTAGVITGLWIIVKNRLSTKTLVVLLRYAFGVAVALCILMFAALYWNIALFTDGEAFEYTRKAVTTQSRRAIAGLFPELPPSVIARLVDHYESAEKRRALTVGQYKDARSGITIFPVYDEEQIGDAWAKFYQWILNARGATRFRLVKFTGPSGFKDNTESAYELLLYRIEDSSPAKVAEWMDFPDIQIYGPRTARPFEQHVIMLPTDMKFNEGVFLNSDRSPMGPDEIGMVGGPGRNYAVRVRLKSQKEFVPEIYSDYLLGIGNLPMYLRYSQTFVDDSPKRVQRILETQFLNSFMDYFYLSMVTFSTTGYGDVVAVDRQVRLLTMMEIAFGWPLLTLFGWAILAKAKTPLAAEQLPPIPTPSPKKYTRKPLRRRDKMR